MPEQLIPLFPLPSGVLFPGALMPLHVFEPRYRAMMAHALQAPAGERKIAIALLAEGYEPVYETLAAPIHPVVCVGNVTDYEELVDGRYNLLLAGSWRGRVVGEDRSGPFRLARLDRIPTSTGSFDAESARLVDGLQRAARMLVSVGAVEGRLFDWITETSGAPEELIDRLAYYTLAQGNADLRQAILAESDLCRRAEMLTEGMIGRARSSVERVDVESGAAWPPPTDSN